MLLLYLSNEAWHSLVVRSVRDRKAASSNLVASTMKKRAIFARFFDCNDCCNLGLALLSHMVSVCVARHTLASGVCLRLQSASPMTSGDARFFDCNDCCNLGLAKAKLHGLVVHRSAHARKRRLPSLAICLGN